jgi:hypothetical protein
MPYDGKPTQFDNSDELPGKPKPKIAIARVHLSDQRRVCCIVGISRLGFRRLRLNMPNPTGILRRAVAAEKVLGSCKLATF